MQKRERSPDQRIGFHQAKQFIWTGRGHISEPAANSHDVQYESNSAIKGITCQDDEQEAVCSSGCECHVPGCNQSFASMTNFEAHYTMCHRFVCRYCQRFYSTNHLLEIHLTENHDSFFSLLSQQQPMYCCLEENCNSHFMDAQSRLDHMTSCHGYPANFLFDRRQSFRTVDTTGGLEESRDVDVADQKKSTSKANCPSSTKVPEAISFGIGHSEFFNSPGS
ncbi:zinc finger protein 511 isoform X1 [Strongylocentrotus purpuratus]|uniref:C2H2-type domain-containing protein n=1 Tax=Strongylocentrotus purpuratus TaxID=7668 RepID=A0A7M7HEU4_STRPU|nr:zinc finger protein 511 isoform X1 [Strongylocentrotus purpuratus]|eukprot:XP_011660693.1 PREDICTED: zinc finger protein 511 isoform X1 [Strongylocentrotus purpuratus]